LGHEGQRRRCLQIIAAFRSDSWQLQLGAWCIPYRESWLNEGEANVSIFFNGNICNQDQFCFYYLTQAGLMNILLLPCREMYDLIRKHLAREPKAAIASLQQYINVLFLSETLWDYHLALW
jgi:hypothetical protein